MKRLRGLRESAGLSQDRLGELSGVSRFAIIDYEQGRSSPTFLVAQKIAVALHCSLTDLDASEESVPGSQRNSWEVRVIFEADDDWRDKTMDMRSEAANTFSVHISPTKIGIEIIGNVEDETQLDSLLAEARAKALDAMAMRGKYRN